MKKALTAALSLLLCSVLLFWGLSERISSVRNTMKLTTRMEYGDVTAAEGITLALNYKLSGSRYPNLTWDVEYPVGRASQAAFHYSPLSFNDTQPDTEENAYAMFYSGLNLSASTSNTQEEDLRELFFSDLGNEAIADWAMQCFHETPVGQKRTYTVPLHTLCTYYPLIIDVYIPGVYTYFDAQGNSGTLKAYDGSSSSPFMETIRDFFKLTVPEEVPFTISIERSSTGVSFDCFLGKITEDANGNEAWESSAALDINAVATQQGIFFLITPEDAARFSPGALPQGCGVYCMPTYYNAQEGGLLFLDAEKIQYICPLPEDCEAAGLEVISEEQAPVLCTLDGDTAHLAFLSQEAVLQSLELLHYRELGWESDEITFHVLHEGDLLVVLLNQFSNGHERALALLQRNSAEQYQLVFSTAVPEEDLLFRYFDYSIEAIAYDGSRLILASRGSYPYGVDMDAEVTKEALALFGENILLSVYTAEGLQYSATMENNLANCPPGRERGVILRNIEPIGILW